MDHGVPALVITHKKQHTWINSSSYFQLHLVHLNTYGSQTENNNNNKKNTIVEVQACNEFKSFTWTTECLL